MFNNTEQREVVSNVAVWLYLQNQLQRLRTEEVLRQQSNLKSCPVGEEEEEEEDESSNSTTSSPCLRHKDQQNSRYWNTKLRSNISLI